MFLIILSCLASIAILFIAFLFINEGEREQDTSNNSVKERLQNGVNKEEISVAALINKVFSLRTNQLTTEDDLGQ